VQAAQAAQAAAAAAATAAAPPPVHVDAAGLPVGIQVHHALHSNLLKAMSNFLTQPQYWHSFLIAILFLIFLSGARTGSMSSCPCALDRASKGFRIERRQAGQNVEQTCLSGPFLGPRKWPKQLFN
jgi:hypothetical protein